MLLPLPGMLARHRPGWHETSLDSGHKATYLPLLGHVRVTGPPIYRWFVGKPNCLGYPRGSVGNRTVPTQMRVCDDSFVRMSLHAILRTTINHLTYLRSSCKAPSGWQILEGLGVPLDFHDITLFGNHNIIIWQEANRWNALEIPDDHSHHSSSKGVCFLAMIQHKFDT